MTALTATAATVVSATAAAVITAAATAVQAAATLEALTDHAVGRAATTTMTSEAARVDSTALTATVFTLSFFTCRHWAIFSLAT